MLARRFASTVVVLASVLAGSPCIAAADPPVFVVRGESERGPRISYAIDGPTGAEVARGRCRTACEVDPAWWAGPGLYVLHVDHDATSVAFELLGNEPAVSASLARDLCVECPRVTVTRIDERLRARLRPGGMSFEVENGTDLALVARESIRGADWVIGKVIHLVNVLDGSREPPHFCAFDPATQWPSVPAHETTELMRAGNPRRAGPPSPEVVRFSALRYPVLTPGHNTGWIPLWTAEEIPEIEVIYLVPFGFTFRE